ncbi:MAG: HutD family protein [Bacteroidetes bacterium]|nr:HutD family protein [Bacteroidota bacterium]
MKVLFERDFKTSSWAGGTTTELFIYPEGSDYSSRNFDFRLSSARVLQEESVFTALPGFYRCLMVLDGALIIRHKGVGVKHLSQFETHTFDGGWATTSQGQCTDFNLMVNPIFEGGLNAVHLEKGTNFQIDLPVAGSWLFVFVLNGEVRLFNHKEKHLLPAGSLIVIRHEDHGVDHIEAINPCNLVLVKVFRKN